MSMKIIITENQFNLLLEQSNPCPKGVEIDPLVTIDELKSGKKTIKKGYCNYSENSAIVKVQQMLKKQGYSLGDSAEGYYGDKTQEAIIDLWLKKNNKNVLGTEIGQKTLELFSDEKKLESKDEKPSDLFNKLTKDEKIIVCTLLGEAGGESNAHEGMKAVLNVLKNRAEKNHLSYGNSLVDQALAKYQFSMWNDKSLSDVFNSLKNHDKMKTAINLVKNVKNIEDNTNGSLFYYVKTMHKEKPGVKNKDCDCLFCKQNENQIWKDTTVVGSHQFGNYVKRK